MLLSTNRYTLASPKAEDPVKRMTPAPFTQHSHICSSFLSRGYIHPVIPTECLCVSMSEHTHVNIHA